MSVITESAKKAVRSVLPLPVRKSVAVWLSRQSWMPRSDWWAVEIIADWAKRDPNSYHRFCWAHHLGYAESYEVSQRFGEEKVHPSRHMLFDDLMAFLAENDINPAADIRTIFEVGCSMGYLLRYLEIKIFPAAVRLAGIDIDAYAIAEGKKHLARVGSKVDLSVADMGNMEQALGDEAYDLILCAGVLMYLTADEANHVVTTMLRHTSGYLVLAGLAHPSVDNKALEMSEVREQDGSFIHNLDEMVERAGGSVRFRRWEGPRDVNGNTIYFLICEPAKRPVNTVGAS